MKRRSSDRIGSLKGALRAPRAAGSRRAGRLVRRTHVRVYNERGLARTLDPGEGRGEALAAAASRMLDAARR